MVRKMHRGHGNNLNLTEVFMKIEVWFNRIKKIYEKGLDKNDVLVAWCVPH